MTERHAMPLSDTGDLHQRASTVRGPAGTAPDLRHIALARRLSLSAVLGVLGLLIGSIVVVGVLANAALPWLVGAVLALAVTGVVVAGAHAGGHGWFVPLPVLVLAAVWAITVSSGHWSAPLAWVLAALVFGGALLAAVLIVPALTFRRPAVPAIGSAALVGASGITVSPLSPAGIARVNNETWTAESLSGPLAAGVPVHVARVEGLRLLVWSEAGQVPGPEALGFTQQTKEDA